MKECNADLFSDNIVPRPCPLCCSACMIETETSWVCPVCGAVVDKS